MSSLTGPLLPPSFSHLPSLDKYGTYVNSDGYFIIGALRHDDAGAARHSDPAAYAPVQDKHQSKMNQSDKFILVIHRN